MNRRITITALSLILLTLLAGAAFSRSGERTQEEALLNEFAEAMSLVEQNYVDKIDYEGLVKRSILGMLHTLDPHSSYFDKREFQRFRVEQTSQYFGIGATIGARSGKVYVLAPFENTPAHRAGLRYGDQLTAVNGESTENWPSPQVSERLRGPRGTPVEVTVLRIGEKQPLTFKLLRDAVPLPSISSAYLIRSGVAYINLSRGFNTTTDDELEQALNKLASTGMSKVVLDLRGNPGGFLEQAVRVAQEFLYNSQLIVTQQSRANKRNFERPFTASDDTPNLMPLVVLVNGTTASASEIVAGAIQEHDRGVLVGEPTFGKALVQTIFPLPFGAGLTLSTARYLTPSGRFIQKSYSDLSFYDYLARHRDEGLNPVPLAPSQEGPAFRTDAGRTMYGGGGLRPDYVVASTRVTRQQTRLLGPVFLFARELVGGAFSNFGQYRVDAIRFNHQLEDNEYRVTDELLDSFKKYTLDRKDEFRIPAKQIDENREFIRTYIRFEIVSAAYGLETASTVLNELDLQLLKAIEALPRATELANGFRSRVPAKRTSQAAPTQPRGRAK